MKSTTKKINGETFHLFSGAEGKFTASKLKKGAKERYKNVRITKCESLSRGTRYFIWVREKR